MSFALGVMGLGLESFLDLTPFEFIEAKLKFFETENKQERERWEIARWMCFRIAAPPKGHSGMVSITDFIRFPWEGKSIPEKRDKTRQELALKRYGLKNTPCQTTNT